MHTAARLAKLGDKAVTFMAFLLILVMLLFGGYSLWDMWSTAHGAFISSDLLKYKPKEDDPENLSLLDLIEINPDVRGWLTIDKTHIDYPFVQGKDDMEYVNKDIMGKFSLSGAIFLSSRNAGDMSDSYNLFYGHHVDGGAMFADISEYKDPAYFDKHTTGSLRTMHGNYKIQIFALAAIDAYDRYVYRDQAEYNSPSALGGLLDYLRANAVDYREIGVSASDKIIALSTCTSAATNGRMVLFGKLIRE